MIATVAQKYSNEKYTWNILISRMFFKMAVYFYMREVYACIKFYSQHGKTSLESHGPSTQLYGDWAIPRLMHKGYKSYWKTEDGRTYLVVSWSDEENPNEVKE